MTTETSPPLQFEYRGLTRHDLPELSALQRRLFPVDYNEKFYESLLSVDVITILAFHNEKMVGVVTGRVKPRTSCFTKYHGYIITLGVDADYRRHQLGSKLLLKLQQDFERSNCEYVYLHCKADNDSALTFYAKHGYEIVRRLPGYYVIDDTLHDAYVVSKQLPQPKVVVCQWLWRALYSLWAGCILPLSVVHNRRRKLKFDDAESF